ncbi:hypothetical protein BC941DRAFT_516041 [Chlamydoabsidia padenii]|nr:hypothetical protein BC941DRAFT_516041 [Chlamydoabsidia padenii]
MRSQIEIKWQGRTFPVDINEEDLDTCTVLDLKEKCHRFTGLPVENMKLLAYGAVMKNNNLPLGHYGIRPGAKLRLMGSNTDKIEQVNKLVTNNKTPAAERQSVEDLQRILDKLKHTIVPDIDAYESQVKTHNLSGQAKDDKLITKGLYFAEILMQLLFEFDGVKCNPGFDHARQLRKEGVNTAQELLDKVDRLRNSIK